MLKICIQVLLCFDLAAFLFFCHFIKKNTNICNDLGFHAIYTNTKKLTLCKCQWLVLKATGVTGHSRIATLTRDQNKFFSQGTRVSLLVYVSGADIFVAFSVALQRSIYILTYKLSNGIYLDGWISMYQIPFGYIRYIIRVFSFYSCVILPKKMGDITTR